MDYNPAFVYPANLQNCKKHREACRIFKGSPDETYDFEKCKCCGKSIGVQNPFVPCCYNPAKELTFLGPGVPLLFVFTRIAVLLLISLFLLYGIYALVSNLTGSGCDVSTTCQNSIFVDLSIANKIYDAKSLSIQNYLLTGFIFLYILFIQYLTYFMRKKERSTDDQIDSPSDYSILISQLPEGSTERDIVKMIEEERKFIDKDVRMKTDNLSVKDIVMSYELTQYLKEMQEEEENYANAKKDNINYHFKHIVKPTKYSTLAVVIFNQQAAKDAFQETETLFSSIKNCLCNFCLNVGSFQVKGKSVVVERAPEPDDIKWQNADISRRTVIFRKILTNFCCVIILVIGGYVQYVLQVQKNKITDINIKNVYNIISSASIAIFNFIISLFLEFVTSREGDCTQTHQNASLLVKASLFQFFNAGIFYTFARIMAQEIDQFDIKGNQSYELTLFMIFNAFLPNVINVIFTALEIPTSIQRWLFMKGCLKYNQKKANQIFQCPKIQFPIKYAYIIRTIWLTCFYATFVPIVIPISILGLIFFYLGEQYLFRNYYSVPYMLSKFIVYTAIDLLNYTGLILLSGSFLIVYYISYKLEAGFTIIQAIPYIIGLFLSLFIILIPSFRINEKLFPFPVNEDPQPIYDQACKKFSVTYKGTHPLSSYAERMNRTEVNLPKLLQMIDIKGMQFVQPNNGSTSNIRKWYDLQSSRNPFNRLLS